MDAPTTKFDVSGSLSRRSLLIGAGGVSLAAVAAVAGPASMASAAAPTTPSAVITEAKSYTGNSLAQMNAIWSSKYKTSGDWCAIFVSWCLRGTDTGFSPRASDFYKLCTPVSAANVRQGDIIWYYGVGHIGLVRSHSDGHIRTVEGNVGSGNASTNHVKIYEDPWDTSGQYKFARPKY
ncbi:CHAP domain-containing protein [Curtobacterium sp. MCBD17_003]|uniref:CHAP domain-containing protein n=1 Tax=Curtobacterium sp. MCBD17_003 TaxID=2175667 RepID=UPI000DA6E0FD|nr:CHAP domain-containing protein [Curtobacterium sp. MCBD17_003]WIE55661.1 CHAP domain-containing protein [Curtobacterium sp. MCBD17_003]